MNSFSRSMKDALDKIWSSGTYHDGISAGTIRALYKRELIDYFPDKNRWVLTEKGLFEWQKLFNGGSTCVVKRKQL